VRSVEDRSRDGVAYRNNWLPGILGQHPPANQSENRLSACGDCVDFLISTHKRTPSKNSV